MITLPQDVLNEIMKYIDVKTIHHYCMINQQSYKIGLSNEFWKYKLNQYHLPMPHINLTLNNYINLYTFIIDINTLLNSNALHIICNPNSKHDIRLLIKKYEKYLYASRNRDNIMYLSNIYIRRRHRYDKFFVSFILFKNIGIEYSQSGEFDQNILINLLYELYLYDFY